MKNFQTVKPLRQIYASPLRFLWEAVYGARKWLLLSLTLAFLLQVAKVLVPVFFANLVDYFAQVAPDNVSWSKVFWFLGLMLLAYVGQSLIRTLRELFETIKVRNYVEAKIRLFGVNYLAKHSEKYFSAQKTGQLSEKVKGCSVKASYASFMMSRVWSNVSQVSVNLFFIGRVSFWFLGLVLVFGIGMAYLSYKISLRLSGLSKDSDNKFDEFNGVLADSIGNALTVKAFGSEDYEDKVVQESFDVSRDARLKLLNTGQNLDRLQSAIMGIFDLIILSVLIWLWYGKKITIGEVTLVLLLLDNCMGCFKASLRQIFEVNEILGGLKASMMPFVVPHDIVDVKGAKNLKITKGEIQFKNVVFTYDKKKVFDNLSFKIRAKEKVGIVGASGSGKSTLINLLQRAYDIQSGEILIDGQNIAKVKQNSISDAISLIPQDTSLFHRTIGQNIAYGCLRAPLQDIKKAAKLAYADGFIERLAKGYLTKVGEKGVKLSGGQRQRIAIARAILKNSPILILDEATSALDSEAEKYIQKAMKNLMKNKTVIAIAHRLSTLKEMDRIIVLDEGKIVEEGKIDELLQANGVFKHLWEIQGNL